MASRFGRILRKWETFLKSTEKWNGPQTPVFFGPGGKIVSAAWINETLKAVAALAGIRKRVSTHVIRKSVGTLIATKNPKLAQEQLGITSAVFNQVYNQPTIEDRTGRRDILPAFEKRPRSPHERITWAVLEHRDGRLPREDMDQIIEDARRKIDLPKTKSQEFDGYV